jgi:4'-phosphopantetheinyl transferase
LWCAWRRDQAGAPLGNPVLPRSCIAEPLSDSPVDAGIQRAFIGAWRGRDAGSPERPRILVALAETSHWQPWLPQAERLLDPIEVARVRRCRSAIHRDMLTLAYALHRSMLGAVLGLDPVRVPLHRDERGRPRLDDDIATTSLSHADGAIAIAVAFAGPVGVDIEPQARAAVMGEIAARVCDPVELDVVGSGEAQHRDSALLALWVRKEAVLKAAGIGLAIEMDSFHAPDDGLVRLPDVPGMLAVRMLEAPDHGHDHWSAAVAGPPGAEVEYGWTGLHGVSRYCRVSLAPRGMRRPTSRLRSE